MSHIIDFKFNDISETPNIINHVNDSVISSGSYKAGKNNANKKFNQDDNGNSIPGTIK